MLDVSNIKRGDIVARQYRNSYNFAVLLNPFVVALTSVVVHDACRMKILLLLATATLFVVCSPFPTVGGQQSSEFCTTLAYPQEAPAAYVHLCYTPGKGISTITRILFFCI